MIPTRNVLAVAVILLTLAACADCADNSDKMADAARDQGRSQAIARQADAVLPAAKADADAKISAADQAAAASVAAPTDAALAAAAARAVAAAAEAKAKADDIAAIKAAAEQRAAADAAAIDKLKQAEAARQIKDAATLGQVNTVAGGVAPFVPAPYGELFGLAVGVVGGIGAWIGRQRAAKFKSIAENIVSVIENAQTDAGVVNFDDPLTRAKMRADLGPAGHALVKRTVAKVAGEDA